MTFAINFPPERLGPFQWDGHRPDGEGCSCRPGLKVDFRDHLCAVATTNGWAVVVPSHRPGDVGHSGCLG